MSRREDIEQRTEALLQPIVDRLGFELIDVEFVKEAGEYYLRSYIDKEGGITIDDCEAVSRELNPLLDEEDYIEEGYIMEVSSPGLGRPLKKEKDFVRNIGKRIELKTYRAIGGTKDFEGVLTAFDEDSVTLQEEESERSFLRKEIALIRQAFDF